MRGWWCKSEEGSEWKDMRGCEREVIGWVGDGQRVEKGVIERLGGKDEEKNEWRRGMKESLN